MRKPPWLVAGIVILFATYVPISVMIASVDSLPQGFIGPLVALLPCHLGTPLVLVAGTYFGRKSVLALVIISGILLATTSFTAFLVYSLLDA